MQTAPTSGQETKIAMKTSVISIIVNVLLSGFKLVTGIVGHSSAMISDAVHSASDVFSTFVVMLGVSISGKERDEGHPYGHERFESLAAILLALILMGTGLGIGWNGLRAITGGDYKSLRIPGVLPLSAAIISIAVKEWMYQFTRVRAKKINSDALMADAWHHRSDALSSIGSMVGILGARLGFPVFGPLASVVICLFILKAAIQILADAVSKLTDTACDAQTEAEITKLVLGVPQVLRLDLLQTRKFGSKIYVDIEISADEMLLLRDSHHIAETVHDTIEAAFPTVKHCMVHVNPMAASDTEAQ